MSERSIRLLTEDAVPIHAAWGTHNDVPGGRVIVIAPGYTQSSGTRVMLHVAEILRDYGDTLSLDFRGTGRSGGRYTFAGAEVLDLRATLVWAKERFDEVVVAGFSMGASIAVQTAAVAGEAIDRLLLVSIPTTLGGVIRSGGPIVQGLSLLLQPESVTRRRWAGGRVTLRYGNPFHRGSAVRVAPGLRIPAVFVIGERDRLVPPAVSHRVYAAYGGPKRIVWVDGGRHAEFLAVEHEPRFRLAIEAALSLGGGGSAEQAF